MSFRVTLFQAAFSEHAMAARLETIPIGDLIEAVNRRQPGNPFSKEEVETILRVSGSPGSWKARE